MKEKHAKNFHDQLFSVGKHFEEKRYQFNLFSVFRVKGAYNPDLPVLFSICEGRKWTKATVVCVEMDYFVSYSVKYSVDKVLFRLTSDDQKRLMGIFV